MTMNTLVARARGSFAQQKPTKRTKFRRRNCGGDAWGGISGGGGGERIQTARRRGNQHTTHAYYNAHQQYYTHLHEKPDFSLKQSLAHRRGDEVRMQLFDCAQFSAVLSLVRRTSGAGRDPLFNFQ